MVRPQYSPSNFPGHFPIHSDPFGWCKRVDELQPEDQNIICHFLDMAVRQDQLRQIVANPAGSQRTSKGGR